MAAHRALLSGMSRGMSHGMQSCWHQWLVQAGGGARCAGSNLTIVYLAFVEAYHEYVEATLITEQSTQGDDFAKFRPRCRHQCLLSKAFYILRKHAV